MFEQWLLRGCDWYWDKEIAYIEKTPEPMRPIKVYGDRRRGQFIAIYTKQAQSDFTDFYRIPWSDWKAGPEKLGRKHFKRTDLEPYHIRWRGTFTVVSGVNVRDFKKAGYSYHHEDSGYTVVSDGKHAVAIGDVAYLFYYGGQRSFTL